jgi:hypothetical protein
MQTDKDFFSPEYIRHILVKLRPWKGLVLISRPAFLNSPEVLLWEAPWRFRRLRADDRPLEVIDTTGEAMTQDVPAKIGQVVAS